MITGKVVDDVFCLVSYTELADNGGSSSAGAISKQDWGGGWTHAATFTPAHAHLHSRACTHQHTNTHLHIHPYTLMHIHPCTHPCTHPFTLMHIHNNNDDNNNNNTLQVGGTPTARACRPICGLGLTTCGRIVTAPPLAMGSCSRVSTSTTSNPRSPWSTWRPVNSGTFGFLAGDC